MKLNFLAWLGMVLFVVIFGVIGPLQKKLLDDHNKEIHKVEKILTTQNNAILIKEVKELVYVVQTKEIKVKETHSENANKIEQAPGSNDPIGTEFVSVINGGLCKYKDTVGCP